MLKVCTLASGSSGNCTYISDGITHLMIDAGISARSITNGLASIGVTPGDISGILITHEHSDHIRGLEVLEKKWDIPIFAAHEGTFDALRAIYPALEGRIMRFDTDVEFAIGDIKILPFKTPHDTEHSVGFRIDGGGSSVVYATDLGHVPQRLNELLKGTQMVVLEANYDEASLARGPYPAMLKRRIASECGHLSNSECAKCAVYAAQCGVKCLVLGHLSRENNTPRLAYDTVHRCLTDAGIIPGVDVMLQVAPRSEPGHVYQLDGECLKCGK